MQKILAWLQQLQLDSIWEILILIAASLLCITVHETAHGLVAYWLGDDTAKKQGRLSLNPLRHIDPLGLLMMAVARFGWAKPVPVDMRHFRKPKTGMAVTALAGPLSNVLLMLLAAIVRIFVIYLFLIKQWKTLEYAIIFLEYVMILSAGLAVFNVFPIPPLDGSKVLFSFLTDRLYWKLMRYERYGMILMAALLFTDVLDAPLFTMRQWLFSFTETLTQPLTVVLQGLL